MFKKGWAVGSNKKIIVQSNWKMHKTHAEGIDWIESLKEIESKVSREIEIIACVPQTILRAIAQAVQTSSQISSVCKMSIGKVGVPTREKFQRR